MLIRYDLPEEMDPKEAAERVAELLEAALGTHIDWTAYGLSNNWGKDGYRMRKGSVKKS